MRKSASTDQCCGSMTFWCGFGSGSASADPSLLTNGSGSWIRTLLFSSLTFKIPTKKLIKKKVFLLITFEGTSTLFFKDKNSHTDPMDPDWYRFTSHVRSQNANSMLIADPDPMLIADPDPAM